jgi:hypothetical protein
VISFDGAAPDRERTARVLDGLTASAGLVPRPAGGPLLDDDEFLSTDETLDVAPAEAPLRRYLRFQVQDFARQRAVWLFALGLLALFFFRDNYDPALVAASARRGEQPEIETWREIVTAGLSGFAMLATLFSVHGIVSAERERGLQRFLFAKPIARIPYYLQKLGVAFVGVLALVTVMTLLTGAVFTRAVPLESVLLMTTALFASVGGLTFLLSTLVRFDGGLAIIGTLAVIPLSRLAYEDSAWAALGALRFLLPPLQRLVPLVDFGAGDPLRALLTALAYGAVYVALGIAVLRRRSILT